MVSAYFFLFISLIEQVDDVLIMMILTEAMHYESFELLLKFGK